MSLKEWLENRKSKKLNPAVIESKIAENDLSKLWTKCFNCSANIPTKDVEKNLMVCTKCGYHFRINARTRLEQIIDKGTFEELDIEMTAANPLDFVDTKPYMARQKEAKEKTGLNEAVVTGIGKINGNEVAVAVMDFEYMGGSMGSVVGEKITRAMEEGLKRRIPVIAFTSSGGARMQESVLSLMQMAKTSCAVAQLNDEGILYIAVLTEPTFGGVTASFGTIGDIIVAEQGARIGFAGRRVIEQTIRQKLPSDFQTAEYLMKYGQVDIISKRVDLKDTLSKLLLIHNVN
jgi:acetyl-CoA carboxylase carboxyl transferase subunit beta